jgi:hypothetical protein
VIEAGYACVKVKLIGNLANVKHVNENNLPFSPERLVNLRGVARCMPPAHNMKKNQAITFIFAPMKTVLP